MSSKNFTEDLGTRILKPHRTKLNRRHFLLGIAAISVTAIVPGAISCSASPVHDIHNQLTDFDFATLTSVENHLFPTSKNSPGAIDINAPTYFSWCLMDTEKDPMVIRQLRDGIKNIEEEAQKMFTKKFVDLSFSEKEQALRSLEKERYGENWISMVLTNIFEALLSDPIYGANSSQSGWNWLEHTPGIPRPTKANIYKNTAL
ncbi:MAG: gluconate 2-dehydrogenase subunit 3 family protein [Salibacteraceae bacterium]